MALVFVSGVLCADGVRLHRNAEAVGGIALGAVAALVAYFRDSNQHSIIIGQREALEQLAKVFKEQRGST